ncbi:MAG: FMN-binding negative transcriptional regulator [Steroidobacter sp.]
MTTNRFAPRSDQDVVELVLNHPLVWVVSGGGDDFRATLLPVRPELDANGRITRLVGHFARSNDHYQLLQKHPRALLLVLGVQGYISPSWMQDKTQAPTWNYASAQFLVDVDFFEESTDIEAHLRDLVDTMEAARPNAWSIEQMGPRYRSLSKGVIGFRAEVREIRAKFKLGQDERDDVFRDITVGLSRAGGSELLQWMNEFNAGRTGNDGNGDIPHFDNSPLL